MRLAGFLFALSGHKRNLCSKILPLAIAGFLAFSVFTGCSTESSQKILSAIFDGVDSPPPPTRRVRRDLLREIEDLRRELAESQRKLELALDAAKRGGQRSAPGDKETELPAEQAKSWDEAAKLLPKDKSGKVDWVEAMQAGSVAPRPSSDPRAPDQAVLELAVELSSSGSKLFSVRYEHSAHTQWLACKNCHPAIFPLGRQAEPSVITMAKIEAGEYCGACHGKVAFGVENRCDRCHDKIPAKSEWRASDKHSKPIERAGTWEEAVKRLPVTSGTPDWAKALAEGIIAPRPGIDPEAQDQMVMPLDVERVPAAGAMFKAVFPHQAHTAVLACPNCHTAIFQMAKGATPMSMEKINAGQSCGVCHGKVAFPATACGRCHPAMAGGK